MKVLVAGGAGYIGSHMTKMLLDEGHEVVVLDNLAGGHRDAVPGGEFVKGDVGDAALLDELFGARPFDAVVHFASCVQIAESMADPARHYRNNLSATVTLAAAMAKHGVRALVFSSSAAIFGEPLRTPIAEDHPAAPTSPYGRTKLMAEQMLGDCERAYGLRHSCLRAFNAAGADPGGALGERHEPETHLIPLALSVAAGRARALEVFGEDYDTPDGTCIRDYVHVTDLCRAHLLALQRLLDGGASRAYNLGSGSGHSVRQVLDTARRVTARPVLALDAPRRAGDPARLVADAGRARRELDWRPRYSALDTIIAHAWAWEKRLGLPVLRWPLRAGDERRAAGHRAAASPRHGP